MKRLTDQLRHGVRLKINEMTSQQLNQLKDIHGRLVYKSKIGDPVELFGYIREVYEHHIIFQDNETPDTFKIHNVKSFDPMKLPVI